MAGRLVFLLEEPSMKLLLEVHKAPSLYGPK